FFFSKSPPLVNSGSAGPAAWPAKDCATIPGQMKKYRITSSPTTNLIDALLPIAFAPLIHPRFLAPVTTNRSLASLAESECEIMTERFLHPYSLLFEKRYHQPMRISVHVPGYTGQHRPRLQRFTLRGSAHRPARPYFLSPRGESSKAACSVCRHELP